MGQKSVLEIIGIRNNSHDEILEIRVNDTLNLLGFAVIDVSYNQEIEVSNVHRHFFSFPNQNVSVFDIILLHSGKSSDGSKYIPEIDNSGYVPKTIHHFYWGGTNVWNDSGDFVRIIRFNIVDEKKIR